MRPWLPEISFYDDLVPHEAVLNMAIDEALLAVIAGPVLRVYRWARPAVSFGYFERWAPIRAAHPGRDAVRRWTGGGVVLHGEDFTYSLLVPGVFGAPPLVSYGVIHGALCSALVDAGIAARPALDSAAKISQACFENPVAHDILVGGRKVAGAAQRRTRLGLMHQGSIQTLKLGRGFGQAFAGQLAGAVEPRSFEVGLEAERLAAEKYGTRAWLERRA
jgi:lipoate-protein ligase A